MAVTNYFKEAVRNNNLMSVHIMMNDSMIRDATFKEFCEMEREASSMKDLYVPHDGREFDANKANWNDKYLARIQAQLMSNFSRERVEHLKEVITYLYPVDSAERQSYKNQKKNEKKMIECTSGAGGIIGGGIALGVAVHEGVSVAAGIGMTLGGAAVGLVGGAVFGLGIVGAAKLIHIDEGNKHDKNNETDLNYTGRNQRGGM